MGLFSQLFRSSHKGIAIGGDNLGISVTGDVRGNIMIVSGERYSLSDLSLPWRVNHASTMEALLHWRSRLTPMVGRDDELNQLISWAENPQKLSLKLLTGFGGVGKSRLAGEFAEALRLKDWAAGHADIEETTAYVTGENGTLVIIDYAEERLGKLHLFLERLSRIDEPRKRLRILLTTRKQPEQWEQELAAVADIVDYPAVILGPLAGDDRYQLFEAAYKQACASLEKTLTKVESSRLSDWMNQNKLHESPLFIVAFAVQLASEPMEDVQSGKDVFNCLVRQERLHWSRVSKSHLPTNTLFRLKALACVTDGLNSDQLKALAADSSLNLGLPPQAHVVQILREEVRDWDRDKLPLVEPDLLGAAVLSAALHNDDGTEREDAGQWLSKSLELSLDTSVACARASRLSWDMTQLQLSWPAQRLAQAVIGNVGLCEPLANSFTGSEIAPGLLPLSAAVWGTLAQNPGERLSLPREVCLRNLARCQFDMGDVNGAFESIFEANEAGSTDSDNVSAHGKIDQGMMWADMAIYAAASGKNDDANWLIDEASKSLRTLYEIEPQKYALGLAMCLSNRCVLKLMLGDIDRAIESGKEAVHLANTEATRSELAIAFKNLAKCLQVANRTEEALDAIGGALEIYEELVQKDAARYNRGLAAGLTIKARCFASRDQYVSAIDHLSQALILQKMLAEVGQIGHKVEYLNGLDLRSTFLSVVGEFEAAKGDTTIASGLWRSITKIHPEYFKEYSKSLHNLAIACSDCEELDSALESIDRAIDVRAELTDDVSSCFDWASSLVLRGDLHLGRDKSSSLANYRAALKVLRQSDTDENIFAPAIKDIDEKIHGIENTA